MSRRPQDALNDFELALARLIMGTPNDPGLRALSDRGRLKVSIVSVAKEAGRSRTLIGFEGCAYPAFRRKVLETSRNGPSVALLREAFRAKAKELDLVKRQLTDSQTIQAMLLLELEALRKLTTGKGLSLAKK